MILIQIGYMLSTHEYKLFSPNIRRNVYVVIELRKKHVHINFQNIISQWFSS